MSTPAWPATGMLPRHPLSVGDVLTATFRLFGRRFGQFLVIALIPLSVTLVAGLLATVLTVIGLRLVVDGMSGAGTAGAGIGLLVAGILGLMALVIVAGLMQVKCLGMIALAGRDLEDGRRSTIGDLWRRTRGLAGRALALVLLAMIAVVVLWAVLGVVAFGAYRGGVGESFGILAVIAVPVLVLVAIYLQIRLAFVLQALALEADGPFESLGRSWRTTQGAFWRIFGYLLAAALLVSVIGGAYAGVMQSLINAVTTGPDVTDPFATATQWAAAGPLLALYAVGSALISLFSSPFQVLFTTILYIDQLRRTGRETVTPVPR